VPLKKRYGQKNQFFEVLALGARFPVARQKGLAIQINPVASADGQNGAKPFDEGRIGRAGQCIQNQHHLVLADPFPTGILEEGIQKVQGVACGLMFR
jgi:hypothetical protein